MAALLDALTARFAATGLPLRGDAQRSIFRLNRDVRFTREKHPYKTHMGAVLSRDGSKSSSGLLYLHIDPAGCMLAAGFWHPEPAMLATLRTAIRRQPDGLAAMRETLARAGLALDEAGAMKRLPRGFEDAKGSAEEAALKLRSFVTRRPVAATDIHAAALTDAVERFAHDTLPLLEWGWQAIARKAE